MSWNMYLNLSFENRKTNLLTTVQTKCLWNAFHLLSDQQNKQFSIFPSKKFLTNCFIYFKKRILILLFFWYFGTQQKCRNLYKQKRHNQLVILLSSSRLGFHETSRKKQTKPKKGISTLLTDFFLFRSEKILFSLINWQNWSKLICVTMAHPFFLLFQMMLFRFPFWRMEWQKSIVQEIWQQKKSIFKLINLINSSKKVVFLD